MYNGFSHATITNAMMAVKKIIIVYSLILFLVLGVCNLAYSTVDISPINHVYSIAVR